MGEILGSLFGMVSREGEEGEEKRVILNSNLQDQKEEIEQESGEKQGEDLLRPLKRLRVFSPLGENLLSSVKKFVHTLLFTIISINKQPLLFLTFSFLP